MRRMVGATAAAGLLLLAACSEGSIDQAVRGSTTSTTEDRGPVTSSPPITRGPIGEDEGDDGGFGDGGGFDDGGGSGGGSGDDGCSPEVPIQAAYGRPAEPAQIDPDCPTLNTPPPVETPRLGTGDVQITLRWSSDADLDLHVTEPDGTEISFVNRGPTATGGQLDVDSNIACDPDGSVENVFWPDGDMPSGGYEVEVRGYTVDGCGGGEYTLTAEVQGERVLDEVGEVGEDDSEFYEFEAD